MIRLISIMGISALFSITPMQHQAAKPTLSHQQVIEQRTVEAKEIINNLINEIQTQVLISRSA